MLAKNSKLLNPAVKDRLLFLNLDIIDFYFHDEVEKYLKLLVENASDTSIIEKAKSKFKRYPTIHYAFKPSFTYVESRSDYN